MLDATRFTRDYPMYSVAALVVGTVAIAKFAYDYALNYQAYKEGQQDALNGLALQTNPYAGVGALHMGALHTGAIDYGAINYGAIKKMGMIHY